MTEAELIEAITSWLELTTSVLSVYLTLVSAYLVVAYVAGKKLTFVQLTIINTLYIFMASMTALGTSFYFARAVSYRRELFELKPDELELPLPFIQVSMVVYAGVLFAGIAASVYFMIASRRD